jgi:hypothetical protein
MAAPPHYVGAQAFPITGECDSLIAYSLELTGYHQNHDESDTGPRVIAFLRLCCYDYTTEAAAARANRETIDTIHQSRENALSWDRELSTAIVKRLQTMEEKDFNETLETLEDQGRHLGPTSTI